MENQKRSIEVFTAGCPVCEPVVQLVNDMACSECEVTVYNLSDPCESKICHSKVDEYEIKALPAVVVNGVLLSSGAGMSRASFADAGIGQRE